MITQQVFFFIWIAWIAHPLDLTLFRAEGLGGEGGGAWRFITLLLLVPSDILIM